VVSGWRPTKQNKTHYWRPICVVLIQNYDSCYGDFRNIRGLELFNTIFKLWIKKSYKYQKVDNNEGESDTRMVWTWWMSQQCWEPSRPRPRRWRRPRRECRRPTSARSSWQVSGCDEDNPPKVVTKLGKGVVYEWLQIKGRGQGLCDDITKALVLKSMTMWGRSLF